ncbi:MAG: class I SAM-dependent methyltransferase [Thermoplasmata archaeon]
MPESPRSEILELRRPDGRRVPLRAVRSGGSLLLAAVSPEPEWSRDLTERPVAVVRWSGDTGPWRPVPVRPIADPAAASAAERAMREAIGEEAWRAHFPGVARFWAVEAPPAGLEGTPDPAVAEFDVLAPIYDHRIGADALQRHWRSRADAVLSEVFPSPTTLVEFGAGTGAQTIPLLRRGHRVIAIDPSGEMRGELRRKATAEGLAGRLVVCDGTIATADRVLRGTGADRIGGALALFGAVDLAPSLKGLGGALATRMAPGGPVVLEFRQRAAALPALAFAAIGRPGLAVDRLRRVGRQEGWLGPLAVHRRRAGEVLEALGPAFGLARAEPLSLLSPPVPLPSVARFLGPRGLARLARADARLSARGWGRSVADRLLLVAVRRPVRPPGGTEAP